MSVIRARPARGRGVLLLLVSEMEARLRFLPGFLGASCFASDNGDVIGWSRWTDEAAARTALAGPVWAEHLPVLRSFALETVTACGRAPSVLPEDGAPVALAFRAGAGSPEGLARSVAAWLRSAAAIQAALVVDPAQGTAVLLRPPEAVGPPPPDLADRLVIRTGPAAHYHSIPPPGPDERPMAYRLHMIEQG